MLASLSTASRGGRRGELVPRARGPRRRPLTTLPRSLQSRLRRICRARDGSEGAYAFGHEAARNPGPSAVHRGGEESPGPRRHERRVRQRWRHDGRVRFGPLPRSTPLRISPLADSRFELCSLYVGSLNFALTSEDLREVFQPFGELETVELHRDPATGKSKGYCFVKYVPVLSSMLIFRADPLGSSGSRSTRTRWWRSRR